jgi:hypothetical protein
MVKTTKHTKEVYLLNGDPTLVDFAALRIKLQVGEEDWFKEALQAVVPNLIVG